MKTYRSYDPAQQLLLPPSLEDWLPEEHLARFVNDLVDTLDLGPIRASYEREARGNPPFHPAMMTKVLLYGYAVGIHSSRKLSQALLTDVAFRFLAANSRPDFRTLGKFRRRHRIALAGLFGQVLEVCREAGLVKLGTVAIDGTKLKANASKHKAMSYGRMIQREAEYEALIEEWFAQSDRKDDEEDRRLGNRVSAEELPEHLATKSKRLEKIRAAKQALEAEARHEARRTGKDARNVEVRHRAQRNFTDPESRLQKTRVL